MHCKIVNYCGFSWSRKKRTGRLLHIDYVLLEKQCQQRPHACMDDFSTCFYISQVAENTQACIALYILIYTILYRHRSSQTLTVFFLTCTLFLLDFCDWLNAWGKVNSIPWRICGALLKCWVMYVMNDNARLFP